MAHKYKTNVKITTRHNTDVPEGSGEEQTGVFTTDIHFLTTERQV
jgi:hypothetical protein